MEESVWSQLSQGLTEAKRKRSSFPDLSGDGKITRKDILMGRGVIKKKIREGEAFDPEAEEQESFEPIRSKGGSGREAGRGREKERQQRDREIRQTQGKKRRLSRKVDKYRRTRRLGKN